MNLKNPKKLERTFDEPYESLYNGADLSKQHQPKPFIFAEELILHTNGVKH
jgi:hypothetical protein